MRNAHNASTVSAGDLEDVNQGLDNLDNDGDPSIHAPDWLQISEDLVGRHQPELPHTSELDFGGLLSPPASPLRLYEDVRAGCGGRQWPAGIALAKYLLRYSALVSGKHVIELGAGSGLTTLALALKTGQDDGGAGTRFDMTDQAPMLPVMQKNLKINGLSHSTVAASILDWGTPIPPHLAGVNVVLAADCVYFEPAFPLLLETMKALIKGNVVCYFCFKKRRRADLRFIKDAKRAFIVKDVEDDPEKPIWSREGLFMYQITAR